MNDIKRFIKGFWLISDIRICIASFVPCVFGAALSYADTRKFDLFWFLLGYFAIYLIETGKNSINEIVDFNSGVDPGIDEEHRTPFSGGKKTIIWGLLSKKEHVFIALVTFGLVGIIGLSAVIYKARDLLFIGIAGVVNAIIYSLPPFKLCYRGLGEITVGITFGPLMVPGMYTLMAGSFKFLPVILGIPFGFIVSNILWLAQIPDYESDKAAGKKNMCVRIGPLKAAKFIKYLLSGMFISAIIAAIITRNPLYLLTLLLIPMSVKNYKAGIENYDKPKKLIICHMYNIKTVVLLGVIMSIAAIAWSYF